MAQKELWSIAEKKMLEDRRTLPKEDGDLLREYQTTHEETCLSSRLREDVEGKDEEREYVNKDATEEERKVGKERREREWVEINSTRICLDRLSGSALCGEHFEVLSDAEVESAGISWDVSLCVPVSPLVVTVLFSNANVVCDFFSDSERQFVEPADLCISRRREASVAVECETEMNTEGFEGAPVKAAPATRRRAARPTPQQSGVTTSTRRRTSASLTKGRVSHGN